jgi:molecular chaperone GrpE
MSNNEGTKVRVQNEDYHDEILPSDDDASPSDVVEDEVVQELESQLEIARKEASETYDRLLRTTAEFENYKKRSQREIEGIRKFATESLLSDLLTVVDNLERAIASSAGDLPGDESIVQGVTMTLSEMLRVLEKYGVKPFSSVGEPFDPEYHQAFMQEETDRQPDNTVLNEIQKGYTLHDRLLRPAMVVVSKKATPEDENN